MTKKTKSRNRSRRLTCSKSIDGKDMYYYQTQSGDLKHISKKKAKSITKRNKSQHKSPSRLPTCKPVPEDVRIHRLPRDIRQRLSEGNSTSVELNRLLQLIKSAEGSVRVLNRVCLTEELKRQMEDDYRNSQRSLRESEENASQLTTSLEEQREIGRRLEGSLTNTQRNLQECEQNRARLNTHLEDERVMSSGLVQRIRELNVEKNRNLQEVKRLGDSLQECHNNVDHERLTIRGLEESIRTLREENGNNLRDVIRLNQNLGNITIELERTNQSLNEQRVINDELRRQNDLLIRQSEMDKVQRDELIVNHQIVANNFRETLETLRQELENEIQGLRTERQQLQDSLSAERIVIDTVRKDLESSRQALVDAERSIIQNAIEKTTDQGMIRQLNETLEDLNRNKMVMEEALRNCDQVKVERDNMITQLAQSRTEYEAEKDRLKREMLESSNQCNLQVTQLGEQIRQLSSSLDDSRMDLQNEKERCLKEIQEILESNRKVTAKETDSYENRLTSLNAIIGNLQATINELNGNLSICSTLKGEVEEKMDSANLLLEQEKQRLQEALQAVVEKDTELGRMEAEKNECNTLKEKVEEKMNSANVLLQEALHSVVEKDTDLGRMKAEMEELRRDLRKYESEMKEVERERMDHLLKARELDEKNKLSESRADKIEKKIEVCDNRIMTYENMIYELREYLNELQNKYKDVADVDFSGIIPEEPVPEPEEPESEPESEPKHVKYVFRDDCDQDSYPREWLSGDNTCYKYDDMTGFDEGCDEDNGERFSYTDMRCHPSDEFNFDEEVEKAQERKYNNYQGRKDVKSQLAMGLGAKRRGLADDEEEEEGEYLSESVPEPVSVDYIPAPSRASGIGMLGDIQRVARKRKECEERGLVYNVKKDDCEEKKVYKVRRPVEEVEEAPMIRNQEALDAMIRREEAKSRVGSDEDVSEDEW